MNEEKNTLSTISNFMCKSIESNCVSTQNRWRREGKKKTEINRSKWKWINRDLFQALFTTISKYIFHFVHSTLFDVFIALRFILITDANSIMVCNQHRQIIKLIFSIFFPFFSTQNMHLFHKNLIHTTNESNETSFRGNKIERNKRKAT